MFPMPPDSQVPLTVLKMAGTSLAVAAGLRAMGRDTPSQFAADLWGVALVAGLAGVLFAVRELA